MISILRVESIDGASAELAAQVNANGERLAEKRSLNVVEAEIAAPVKFRKDGRLSGYFKIKDGDDSTFIAERAEPPEKPIEILRANATSGVDGGETNGIRCQMFDSFDAVSDA